jgi:cation transporter-like permease
MIPINSFDPMTLVLLAALNPALIATAFLMGRKADQWQKLPVAAFAAAILGFLLYWMGGQVGLFAIHAIGGEAFLFTLGFAFGLVWATVGYALRGRA